LSPLRVDGCDAAGRLAGIVERIVPTDVPTRLSTIRKGSVRRIAGLFELRRRCVHGPLTVTQDAALIAGPLVL
jgi:hypothetical protein